MGESLKVLWPIAPTESEPKADENINHFFQVMAQTVSVEIVPVYVLGAEYLITSEYFEPVDLQDLKKNLEEECHSYLKKFPNLPIKEPRVIENHFVVQGAEAKFFSEYVSQEKADLVVMSSHGRSGWQRAFLGSFTESFLLQTQCPTIVLGPEYQPRAAMNRALFPLPLGESAKEFAQSLIESDDFSFVNKMTLFHKISMVDIEQIAWAPGLYGLGEFNGGDILKKANESTESYLKSLAELPSSRVMSYEISEDLGSVGEVVLSRSSQYDLVIMKSEAGAFEANILGSVTRDVIRGSLSPVMVFPHKLQKL